MRLRRTRFEHTELNWRNAIFNFCSLFRLCINNLSSTVPRRKLKKFFLAVDLNWSNSHTTHVKRIYYCVHKPYRIPRIGMVPINGKALLILIKVASAHQICLTILCLLWSEIFVSNIVSKFLLHGETMFASNKIPNCERN